MINIAIIFGLVTIALILIKLFAFKRYSYYVCYEYETDEVTGYAGITVDKKHKIKSYEDIEELREMIKEADNANDIVIINYKLLGRIKEVE